MGAEWLIRKFVFPVCKKIRKLEYSIRTARVGGIETKIRNNGNRKKVIENRSRRKPQYRSLLVSPQNPYKFNIPKIFPEILNRSFLYQLSCKCFLRNFLIVSAFWSRKPCRKSFRHISNVKQLILKERAFKLSAFSLSKTSFNFIYILGVTIACALCGFCVL